jgi:hypothetical protein
MENFTFSVCNNSQAEGTGFGCCEQEGLPTESKSDIRADYGQPY